MTTCPHFHAVTDTIETIASEIDWDAFARDVFAAFLVRAWREFQGDPPPEPKGFLWWLARETSPERRRRKRRARIVRRSRVRWRQRGMR